jgi:hypothetical protein
VQGEEKDRCACQVAKHSTSKPQVCTGLVKARIPFTDALPV